MPKGIYRVEGTPPWVGVEYEEGHRSVMPEPYYRERGYRPKFEDLPWQESEASPARGSGVLP
jgi:hypothetical protein